MADAKPSGPIGAECDDLPKVRVTMNQVVAYNITYFRVRRGLTQEQLGQRMEVITGRPWSKATMSALERSWDGNRIRQFDADDLIALSRALEYPVPALLLPPEEDGVDARFRFYGVGLPVGPGWREPADQYGSAEQLIEHLFIEEEEIDASYAGDGAYADRLKAAFRFYDLGAPDSAFVSVRREQTVIDDPEARVREATELRAQAQVLRTLLGDIERAARHLELAEEGNAVAEVNETQRED
jgi:transcriptional regulator with XRE-family HTH domain